jgi:hypothetical protein
VQALKEMDGIVYGWIHERLEKMKDPSFVPPSDLLHLLLTATDDEGTKTKKKKANPGIAILMGIQEKSWT